MSGMKELVYIIEETRETYGINISEEEARAIYLSRKIANDFIPVINQINSDLKEIQDQGLASFEDTSSNDLMDRWNQHEEDFLEKIGEQ